jgi:sec-independent protein translocase protein TatA
MLSGLENPLHLAILLLVVLMIFGAKRLPEVGRSLGTGIRGFRESVTGEQTHSQASETRATLGSGAQAGDSDSGQSSTQSADAAGSQSSHTSS